MPKNEIRYKVSLHTKITGELKDKFDIVKKTLNMTDSELIRNILEEYLNGRKKHPFQR